MFKQCLSTLLIVAVFGVDLGAASKILAITPLASPSHGIWNQALLEALADRGHEITAIMPYGGKNRSGIRYHDVGGKFEDDDLLGFAYLGAKEHAEIFWTYSLEIARVQMQSAAVKEILINNKETYDLIIYEHCATEAFGGVLSQIKAPIVALDAYADAFWSWDAMSVENYPSAYPQPFFTFRSKMNFWERVQNFLYLYYSKYLRSNYLKTLQGISRHTFGKTAADLGDIENNYFDLLLMNSGPPGIDLGRSLPPNVKEVGCMHCRSGEPYELPEDLANFVEDAEDGFILFSLGTNVKSKILPKEILQGILQIFRELKSVKVLWKFEDDNLEGCPDNVKISKWLPQQDILAQDNIRLFITHGGRLSTQEAIFHGVPTVVIPFFADQYLNGERIEEHEVGLRLNFAEFNLDTFRSHVHSILSDPKYTENAKKMSAIARDQPQSALETAIFWTEYVIRHKGANHLRPAGQHLNWFQLHSIDVVAFLLSGVLVFTSVLFILLLKITDVMFKTSKPKPTKQKTK